MTSSYGAAGSLKRQAKIKDLEDRGLYTPDQLSEEELSIVQEKMKKLHALLHSDVRAKYKLEVQFGKNRSNKAPFAGVITFWLSGTKFHGGGDEKIYECPRKDCRAWIFPQQIDQVTEIVDGVPTMSSKSLCGECGSLWPSEVTIGERFCKLTTQNWANALLRVFQRMEFDADLYLKYSREDIRYKAALEMARDLGGEELAKAHRRRGLHIYPLKNLIKDTKHGANLLGRIRAFIEA